MDYKKRKINELRMSVADLKSVDIEDSELKIFRNEICNIIKYVCSKVEENGTSDQETHDIFKYLGSFLIEKLNDEYPFKNAYIEDDKTYKDGELREIWDDFKGRFTGFTELMLYVHKHLAFPDGVDRELEKEQIDLLRLKIEKLQKKMENCKDIVKKQSVNSDENFEEEYFNYQRKIEETVDSWVTESEKKKPYF